MKPLLGSFVAGVLVALAVSPSGLHAQRHDGCDKWETAAGIDQSIEPEKLREIPQYGSVRPRVAPPGWEPFAVAQNGQVVFRRCAAQ